MEEIIKKADVLIEALAYIKAFRNKVTVIKYGGSILGEDRIRKGILQDIVFLNYIGLKPILVHGGGPNISERMKVEGKKTDFFEGMRVTNEETLKVVEEELERLNNIIVREIKDIGCAVLGLSGKNKDLIQVKKRRARLDLGFVGEIIDINTSLLRRQLKKEHILVLCPMGRDKEGKVYNVNADEAASSIAEKLEAEKLMVLTNVKGIMRYPEDENSLLSTLNIKEARELISKKVIQEGMVPKVRACMQVIKGGVKKAHIIDARIPHALLLEIFTDKGIGTEIIK